MDISIRPITEMHEIENVGDLMQLIWGLSDREVVSSYEMKAISRFGVLLGAFNEDFGSRNLIGFVYSFPVNNKRHYSHMMGIHPDFQGKNVGWRLKQRHRTIALEKGVEVIEWTVDPLLGINAGLNFRKLKVICNQYFVNYYGNPRGSVSLYAGLETDRFLVEWYLADEAILRRRESFLKDKGSGEESFLESFPLLNPLSSNKDVPIPFPCDLREKSIARSDHYSVIVPADFQTLKKRNLILAKQWRHHLREICLSLFSQGFYAYDYAVFNMKEKGQHNYYVFQRNNPMRRL